jgi:hypothetical protein
VSKRIAPMLHRSLYANPKWPVAKAAAAQELRALLGVLKAARGFRASVGYCVTTEDRWRDSEIDAYFVLRAALDRITAPVATTTEKEGTDE